MSLRDQNREKTQLVRIKLNVGKVIDRLRLEISYEAKVDLTKGDIVEQAIVFFNENRPKPITIPILEKK